MTGIPYRNIIFIPVFFSFYILFKSIGTPDLLLANFDGRSISSATAEGVDIGARVSVFYKGLFYLAFLLIALTKLTTVVKPFIPEEELKLMNGLSMAGFCLLFFRLLGAEVRPSMHVIFAMLGVIATGSLFHQVRKRQEPNYTIAFLWSVLMAFSFFFFQWQLTKLFSINYFLPLPLSILIAGCPLYLLSTNNFKINYRILRTTFPFIFLPLVSFAAMEGFMIFNQHGFYLPVSLLYFAGLILVLTTSALAFKKYKGIHSGVSHDIILFRSWIPWMLAGIFCIAFYSPVVNIDVDIFENANNILPLHQWFNFGRLPLLDTFNAHTLADFAPGLLYSILNGHDPMGYFVYRFLVQVLVLLLVYFLIYKMTGDGFLALWLTLAYPYIDYLIPSYFNLVPLPILAFIRLYEKQTAKRYIVYFSSLVLMVLWRIDIGMSVLTAGGLSFLILIFAVPSFKVNLRNLYRGILVCTSIVFILFVTALLHSGSHLFVMIKDVLSYLSSYQTYGVKDLAAGMDMEYFSLYFILPSVILLIIAATIYHVRKGNISGNMVISALVIIFLGIFYFSNFQRGLVRHTLIEQWNTALTSYGFFIIAAYVLMLIHKQLPESRFMIFFIVSTLLVKNYVYQKPDLRTNNNYYTFSDKLYASTFAFTSHEKIKRVVEEPALGSRFDSFKEWMDLKYPKATFVDFSNSPMLYYYANRVVPNVFMQSPHTAHSEYLQKRFIDDLANYDVPVAVFSNVPFNFWDYLDGIPNTLRHYRISEYLYRTYKPGFIIGGHSVWVKKDNVLPKENVLYSFEGNQFHSSVTQDSGQFIISKSPAYFDYKIPQSISYNSKIYLTIKFNSTDEGDLNLYYQTTTHPFDDKYKITLHFVPGKNDLFAMLDKMTSNDSLSDIKLEVLTNTRLEFNEVDIFGGENYVDHFSNQPLTASLKWIPYYWGEFDKNYKAGGIKNEQSLIKTSQIITPHDPAKLDFGFNGNKENGNYIRLSLKCSSNSSTQIKLSYGDSEKINGTYLFTIKNDSLFHDYLLRVSSQYNWMCKNNTFIKIESNAETEIQAADILAGD